VIESTVLLTVREIEERRAVQAGASRFDLWTYRPLDELKANPFQGRNDPLTAIHYVDGTPVARMHTIHDEILLNGETCPWIWVGSLQTKETHQRQGLMSRLFAAVLDHARRKGAMVGGAGVTAGGRAAYHSAGLRLWGLAPRQLLLLRTGSFFKTQLGENKIASLAAAGPDALFRVYRWGVEKLLRASRQHFRLERSTEFHSNVEPLFASLGRYPRFSRSLAKMAWRWQRIYARRAPPERDCRLAFLYRHDSPELAGFFTLCSRRLDRPGGIPADGIKVATVLDWCVDHHQPLARAALASFVIEQALELDSEVLEFATTDPWMQAILKRHGFIRIGGYRLFFFAPENTPLAGKTPPDLPDFWWNGCDPEDSYTA